MNAGTIIGQYRIVRQIGEGGMGAVYLAEHVLIGRRAAIKMLLPSLSAQHDIVERFFNEARATTTISDPGIVQVFDFGFHTDGSAFLVMEFLEGEPLDTRVRSLGRLAVFDALRITRQAATSLGAAHSRGIVHRDLKPENIFLVRDQEAQSGERPKILDFGIAKLGGDEPGRMRTRTGALMGTPVYMSPEQCRGAGAVDHRSDIYALGCVLYTMLTGGPPFDGEGMGEIIAAHLREVAPAPSSRVPYIPPAVDTFMARCLAKTPEARFQTMGEMVTAIEGLLAKITAPGAVQQATVAMTPVGPGFRSEYPGAAAAPLMSMPGQIPGANHGTYPGQIPRTIPGSIPGTIPGPAPTTLSQGVSTHTAVPTRGSRGVWIALTLIVLLVGGISGAVVMSGRGAKQKAAASSESPAVVAVDAPDAAVARVAVDAATAPVAVFPPVVPIDAGEPAAEPAVDAPAPPPEPSSTIDAGVPDPVKPKVRPRDRVRPRPDRPRKPTGSGSEELYDTR